jgi:hypothetical protein
LKIQHLLIDKQHYALDNAQKSKSLKTAPRNNSIHVEVLCDFKLNERRKEKRSKREKKKEKCMLDLCRA